ncbi:hypothetical protein FACS189430_12200 [Bacteroidia bacterium]|nr:hypothetical protein FACS189430_12200 [Bacteroidia bacterium]
MQTYLKRISVSVLLVLVMGYLAGTASFNHTHVIDGKLVSHSHPYNNPSHQHSSAQFHTIFLLSHWFFSGAIMTVALQALVGKRIIRNIDGNQEACHVAFINYSLRAPPFRALSC